ncbi:disulfide bond formation protein DsbA [Methylococcaceae bacterium HT2]|nr:disulfide bond formation protein DsbA [Methylococcaceae bacterium HT2]
MQYENNTLYYIYDPMCSWCYAFEQSLSSLQSQLPAELNFKAVLGGLVADSNIPMPAETQAMIQDAWRQIENTVPTVRFNFDFWANNTPYRSTYPACRAVLAAENQSSEFAQAMRKMIQQSYYQDAQNPSLDDALISCADQLALNIDQFTQDLHSPETNNKLSEHIQFSRLLGVSSYPSLRLILKDEIYTPPVDYLDSTKTITYINALLDKHLNSKTDSPCIRQCTLNDQDVCLGCFRLIDEITDWTYASEPERRTILSHAEQRKTLYNKNLIQADKQ